MAKFQLHTEKKSDRFVITIVGTIDEDSSFSTIDYGQAKIIEVDFEKVDAINSCGVREWVKWLEAVPQDVQVEYFNCPSIIVDQINMVGGFLRKGVKVMSFSIPYYCDACQIQTNVLVKSGKDYTGAQFTEPKDVKCSKCGGSTEIDVMEAKYFKFMTRQA